MTSNNKIYRKIISIIKANNHLYKLLLSFYYKVIYFKKSVNTIRQSVTKKIKLLHIIYFYINFFNAKMIFLLFRNDKSLYFINEAYESVMYPTEKIKYFIDDSSVPNLYRFFPLTIPLFKIRLFGVVKKGNWDIKKFEFTKHLTYTGMKDLISKESDMSISKESKHWLKVIRDIKENGYKNYKERGELPTDEVEVVIDRYGEVCFIDGGHRFSIAKILELNEIPIIINLIHEEFLKKISKETKLTSITPQIIINYILVNN